jgi:hypothetical protein
MMDRPGMEEKDSRRKKYFFGGLLHFGATLPEWGKTRNHVWFFACREAPPCGLGASI